MSLDTVVEDIKGQAHARAEEIEEEAEERAEELLEAAREDADRIREEAEASVEREIEQEREQRISAAQLEAKQERLEARRELLERVHDRVEAELAELEGERREELTAALLESAANELDVDDDVEVYARADDEALVSELCTEYDGFAYAGEYDCLGGVVVESDASRVRINNTFDSILEAVWEDNLQTVSERLFEQ
ncbi:V-type ATP synthase subunit E [Salinarchaeum sp. Harcht-Bsk1]|uniref:V-type ATP synthase subunit E n=1 Tax=Salinarchaeum sp. Harcht-Bsk1 TaxID=1333523 RepID=UPI00034244EE|nr:V-type ATP synthase subunit E [Salinarchaeum sp. Harcht-Bsk1]AGN00314.1 V-type ATP synthase subunit E [Salinarchaeum sp. Harcht-Bsk1]